MKTNKDLLDMAKGRLRKTRGISLKEHLCRQIARSILGEGVQSRTLTKLPVTVRDQLLFELTSLQSKELGEKRPSFAALMAAINLLIGPHTKKFELGGMMSFCAKTSIPRRTGSVIEMVVEKAPKLEYLSLKTHVEREYFGLGTSSFECIARLGNLKILKITGFTVPYKTAKFLCKELKNLAYAKFRRLSFPGMEDPVELGADLEDLRSSFSRLKTFLFTTKGLQDLPFKEKLTHLCVEHLPSLWAVQRFAPTMKYGPKHDGGNMPAVPSALRHVCVGESNLDLHTVFPNATHLKVCWTGNTDVDSLLQFSPLKSLALENLPSVSTVNVLLRRYGTHLNTLIILLSSKVEHFCSFKSIFAACPNLEKLTLSGVVVQDDMRTIQFFAQLKEFDWSPDTIHSKFEVSNILYAPNLKKFRLLGWNELRIYDVMRLNALITRNKILSELEHLELDRPNHFGRNGNEIVSRGLLIAISELVANATAFLPNLIAVKFHLYYAHRLGSKYLRSDKKHQIRQIGKYFRNWTGDGSIAHFFRVLTADTTL